MSEERKTSAWSLHIVTYLDTTSQDTWVLEHEDTDFNWFDWLGMPLTLVEVLTNYAIEKAVARRRGTPLDFRLRHTLTGFIWPLTDSSKPAKV